MCDEFDCAECGRHIVRFPCGEPALDPPLCGHCIIIPGWYRDPRLADIFDPEHDRRPQLEIRNA